MQNQAIPTYYQVLKLSLGLGGILNILCVSAIAQTSPAEYSKLELSELNRTNEHSFEPTEPQLSRSERERPQLRRLEVEQAARISVPPPTAEANALLKRLLETADSQAPRFSPSTPTTATDKAALRTADARESALGVAEQSKPKPWSITALSTSNTAQSVSVPEVQNIGLEWGEVRQGSADDWLTEIARTSADTTAGLSTSTSAISTDLGSTEASGAEMLIAGAETEQLTSRFEDERAAGSNDAESLGTESLGTESLDTNSDLLSEILEDQGVVTQVYPVLDEELGTLRLVQLRSRENEELGVLRILRTAQAAPPKPRPPIAFLSGRLGFVDVDNVFRTSGAFVEEQIYQAGTSLYLLPMLSESTSLYAIAETNIARYNNVSQVNYNEVQLQIGLRQRLRPRTFAQIGWRNQRLYSPGYRDKLFGVNHIDAVVSHRSILGPKVWLDSFYQMRLGFADSRRASRFRQTMTLSLNYGITRELRTSLLYQLDLDDYTQTPRYDTYQQILGIVSYNITPESRLSLFGGTRFGNSSEASINLDDTFYGAGINVSVPLF